MSRTARAKRLSRTSLGCVLVVLASGMTGPVEAQITFKTNRVLQVDGTGTSFENCQSIRDALASITDVSTANTYLVRLEPGEYDCGSQTLFIPTGVTIEGSGREQTRLVGQVDNTAFGVVHMSSNTTMRSLTIKNFNSLPSFEAAAVSVWQSGQLANSVTIESAELDGGAHLALMAFNANVIVRFSELLSTTQLSDGFASFRFSVLPSQNAFEGTGPKACMQCADFVHDPLSAGCL